MLSIGIVLDDLEGWQTALQQLIDSGVDRVMTNGGAESVPSGLQQIRQVHLLIKFRQPIA